jgi:GNAT superfamily N-acetyltransferase
VPGGVIWDAPACREAWFGHRLELERAPTDLDAAFARWDEHHAGKGVGRRFLCWETGLDEPWAEIPQRFAPERLVGMARAGGAVPGPEPAAPIRPVTDLGGFAAAAARQEPAFGPAYEAYLRWLHLGLARAGATTFAAFHGEQPVAGATVVPGPEGPAGRWVRFQEVWTDRAWRRRGLCSAVIRRCLAAFPGATFALAAVDGGDAARIYLRLGFQPVSRMAQCSRPVEDAAP